MRLLDVRSNGDGREFLEAEMKPVNEVFQYPIVTCLTNQKMESVSSPIAPPLSATPLAAKQRDVRTKAAAAASTVTPAFLSNLGRATLRGIRKCPRCGVYNGTRGLSCKNKLCGISLRNATLGARKGGVEVVRVIIDSEERDGKERDDDGGGGVQAFCPPQPAESSFPARGLLPIPRKQSDIFTKPRNRDRMMLFRVAVRRQTRPP
ncbi:uncharacterized protein C2orf42 homolog [Festucalex cinctus]